MSDGGTPSTQAQSPTRTVGFFTALVLGLSTIGLLYSGQFSISTLAGAYPLSDLLLILLVALGISLLHAFTYAAVGAAAPRSGADYVLGSRVLSAILAFAFSFSFIIFTGLVAGSLIAEIPRTILPASLRAYAVVSGEDLGNLVVQMASAEWLVILGTVGVVLAFAMNLLKPNQLKNLLLVGLVLGLAAWGILFFQLASAAPGQFEGAWDTAMGAGSYAARLEAARNLGMQSAAPAQAFPLVGLLIGFWIMFGSFSSTFFAGEVKKPGRTLLSSSLAALLVSGALFLGAAWLVQQVVPLEFLSAESLLSHNNPSGATALPFIIFYAALLYPSAPLVLFTAAAWVVLSLTMTTAFFFFSSRVIRAWAKDGILPPGFGGVHPTRRTPVLALFLVSLLALLAVMVHTQPGIVVSDVNYALIAVVCMLFPVIALMLLPFTRKTWFATAPGFVSFRLGPLPLISMVAFIDALVLIALIALHFIFPGNTQPLTWIDLALFGVSFVAGILVYSSRKESLRQKGIELAPTFNDLPQDD